MNKKMRSAESSNLHYHQHPREKYETDALRVNPGYLEMQNEVGNIISAYLREKTIGRVADLGVGTGASTEKILEKAPGASAIVIDLSKQMLDGARERLIGYNVEFLEGDYSETDFGDGFDVVVSVLSIHHQNNTQKKKVFRDICRNLNPYGIFIFGDLVTYRDKYNAALNDVKHYAFLVEHAEDKESLREWAYHHVFLNDRATIEDQIRWLQNAGFSSVEVRYQHLNTALILARKQPQ